MPSASARRANPAPVITLILVDRKLYAARTHLADFYCFLWACYFKENLADLTVAARFDAFADQPAGQPRAIVRRTDIYPADGLNRCSDAAAIAALVGGYLLAPPFDDLLTRVETAPARHCIYTLGSAVSTPAIVEAYVTHLDAVLIDVRHSANSRSPHWRGCALAAQFPSYERWADVGNDNEQSDGPIQLHNPARVVEAARLLLQARSLILLCGCADYHTCHRTIAARYLAMWLNAPVKRLDGRDDSRKNPLGAEAHQL